MTNLPPNQIPSAATQPSPMAHSYDGICEYDNPLPGWWKWLFILTVVASPFYLL